MTNIRLGLENMNRVETIQARFRNLKPISVDLGPTDVVTMALRDLEAAVPHEVIRHRDDPVPCRECDESAHKRVYPNGPAPVPKNAQYRRDFGQAFCENPDCRLHKDQVLISWEYETA